MIFAALLLAQLMTPTPPPFLPSIGPPKFPPPVSFPTPVSVSEREIFDRGLRDARKTAQSLGGELGASIADLNTGVVANINGDQPFALAGMEALPQAILVARPDAPIVGIHFSPDGTTFAAPSAFVRLFYELFTGKLLPPQQAQTILHSLDSDANAQRLRAGLPNGTELEHVAGTLIANGAGTVTDDAGIVRIPNHVLIVVVMLRDAGGTAAQRDAVIAQVARTAVAGAIAQQ